MIHFYWCPQTRASRIHWLLEELGQPYERITIDIRNPESRSDAGFRAASPMGKVPAIRDGDGEGAVTVADSAAIGLYLADRYPSAGLAPAVDDGDRGRYLWWMTYTPGVIEPAMAEKFSGTEPNRGRSGWGDFDLMLETLVKGLEGGPWLLGERFSAADVIVGSSVCFMKQLEPEATLDAYAERCLARPAYRTARAAEVPAAS